VRVGVDGEQAACLGRLAEQVIRRVLAFWPAVDLDRHAAIPARREDSPGIELRFRPVAPARFHPAGAVPEHVDARACDGCKHPGGHGPGGHPQLGVHAGHDDVEPGEQVVALVEGAILEDVDLDTGEDAERGQVGVQFLEERELRRQPLCGQSVRHCQPRRVVGQRDPLVSEDACRLGHLQRRAASVGPVRVRVAVTAERSPHGGPRRRLVFLLEPDEVLRALTGCGLRDGARGRRADPAQVLQAAVGDPAI